MIKERLHVIKLNSMSAEDRKKQEILDEQKRIYKEEEKKKNEILK